MHRDSLGAEQAIRPGEVNWMTAGRGIAHSERFDDPASQAGGAFEMIQSWVALPEAEEECAPAFDHYGPEALPVVTEGGLWMRSEEHTSELQSLMRISYAVFCLNKKKQKQNTYD